MDLKVTRFNFHVENYQTRISFDKQITKLQSKRVKLHPTSHSRNQRDTPTESRRI